MKDSVQSDNPVSGSPASHGSATIETAKPSHNRLNGNVLHLARSLIATAVLVAALLGFGMGAVPHVWKNSTIPAIVRAEYLLAEMTVEELVGQLFVVDLRRENDIPVLELTPEAVSLFERYHPGGVLFFGENIDTIEQTVELISGIRDLCTIPPIVAVDYEGGVVSRLTSSGKIPATRIPPGRNIGDTGSTDIAYETGVIMGRELGVLGFTMNFAPVADILSIPESMIGNRAFSDDPVEVARMVGAMVRGMQAAGVSSVVKHFPGHGNVSGDTHDELVVLERSIEELRQTEFIPFRAAIDAQVDGIMTAHIVVPGVTERATPTTFSRTMITDLLRKEFGHDGLVITDSLTMKAIRTRWGSDESAVRSLLAGADIILHPLNVDSAVRGVLDAIGSGRITVERIQSSVKRILITKLKRESANIFGMDPYEVLGCDEHVATINKILIEH